jgi:hypothetical protein
LSALGNAGTFLLFAALSITALVYFRRAVPETKNRSLPDIEGDLDGPVRQRLAASAPTTQPAGPPPTGGSLLVHHKQAS